jgi:hypothetical protein
MGKKGHGKNGLNEVERDLKIKGTRNSRAVAKGQKECRGVLLRATEDYMF